MEFRLVHEAYNHFMMVRNRSATKIQVPVRWLLINHRLSHPHRTAHCIQSPTVPGLVTDRAAVNAALLAASLPLLHPLPLLL